MQLKTIIITTTTKQYPTYMAPEIVSKIDHCPIYTDMWSLGILFYVMLQGNYPFRAKSET